MGAGEGWGKEWEGEGGDQFRKLIFKLTKAVY